MKAPPSRVTAGPLQAARHVPRSHSKAAPLLDRFPGFQIVSPEGRVGVVEDVRSARPGAEALVVRTGPFKRRLLSIPVDDVFEVVPARRRVLVRTSPPTGGGEL